MSRGGTAAFRLFVRRAGRKQHGVARRRISVADRQRYVHGGGERTAVDAGQRKPTDGMSSVWPDGDRIGVCIGGYSSDYSTDCACGNIAISNVTVYAYVVTSCVNKFPPAIGSAGDATCGSITITDAIVHARSHGINAYSVPAIGAFSYVPEITISGSEIYAYRGTTSNVSYADYIGQGGDSYGYQGGQIQGDITNSTVHKYLYNGETSIPEGDVEFDENGIGTEQS